ncbi:MAG: hypothetical protein A2636_01375 [Elusimicrobia bacterium RIFCSPHIGHO2_01_FULL_64_10]|nr:MAG: hypothetical protein A2636_01375 [Elusimicrobia bacterium RIFCSPHIGHO2_01_FULL_64_10]
MFQPLSNKKVLLTVGPTREYLDSVRYLSNASSGRMGLALARALSALGAGVEIVSGPGVAVPRRFRSVRVRSARDMFSRVRERFGRADVFISAAAVSDFRPARRISGKMSRSGGRSARVELRPNPDILDWAGGRKGRRVVVGFALEGRGGLRRASWKMARKRCDLLILNGPETMESERIRPTILRPGARPRALGLMTKERCARAICREIIRLVQK